MEDKIVLDPPRIIPEKYISERKIKIKVSVETSCRANQEKLKDFIARIEKEYGGNHTLEWELEIFETKCL
ncbi:hypothetical protein [Phascolarctobacterium faecium]|uniref:hypothetical protein n=1 Tax=Phascolarctobacterium faecium TaxID=33025 RepID=UPI003AB10FD2